METGCDKERDTVLAEIPAAVEKLQRDRGRYAIELIVGIASGPIVNSDTCAMSAATRHDLWEHRQHV
jgi:hypothetical protein